MQSAAVGAVVGSASLALAVCVSDHIGRWTSRHAGPGEISIVVPRGSLVGVVRAIAGLGDGDGHVPRTGGYRLLGRGAEHWVRGTQYTMGLTRGFFEARGPFVRRGNGWSRAGVVVVVGVVAVGPLLRLAAWHRKGELPTVATHCGSRRCPFGTIGGLLPAGVRDSGRVQKERGEGTAAVGVQTLSPHRIGLCMRRESTVGAVAASTLAVHVRAAGGDARRVGVSRQRAQLGTTTSSRDPGSAAGLC